MIAYVTRAGGPQLAASFRARTDEPFGDGSSVGFNRFEGAVGGPALGVRHLTWFFSAALQGQRASQSETFVQVVAGPPASAEVRISPSHFVAGSRTVVSVRIKAADAHGNPVATDGLKLTASLGTIDGVKAISGGLMRAQWTPADNFADGCHEFGVGTFLEQIATGSGIECLADVLRVVLHREHEHLRLGPLLEDLRHGRDPALVGHHHVD